MIGEPFWQPRGTIYRCGQCAKWWLRQVDEMEIVREHFHSCSHCHHLDSPVSLKLDHPKDLPVHLL